MQCECFNNQVKSTKVNFVINLDIVKVSLVRVATDITSPQKFCEPLIGKTFGVWPVSARLFYHVVTLVSGSC